MNTNQHLKRRTFLKSALAASAAGVAPFNILRAGSSANSKVVTQMGNQGHAGDGIRKSVEACRAGVIGEVSEVYARNDKPARSPGRISATRPS